VAAALVREVIGRGQPNRVEAILKSAENIKSFQKADNYKGTLEPKLDWARQNWMLNYWNAFSRAELICVEVRPEHMDRRYEFRYVKDGGCIEFTRKA